MRIGLPVNYAPPPEPPRRPPLPSRVIPIDDGRAHAEQTTAAWRAAAAPPSNPCNVTNTRDFRAECWRLRRDLRENARRRRLTRRRGTDPASREAALSARALLKLRLRALRRTLAWDQRWLNAALVLAYEWETNWSRWRRVFPAILGGFAGKAEWRRRRAVCHNCEHNERARLFRQCRQCRCIIRLKTACKTERCPIGRWHKADDKTALGA